MDDSEFNDVYLYRKAPSKCPAMRNIKIDYESARPAFPFTELDPASEIMELSYKDTTLEHIAQYTRDGISLLTNVGFPFYNSTGVANILRQEPQRSRD